MKRVSWPVIGISIFATVIATIVLIYYYDYYSLISSFIQKLDKFGIKKIYPTIEDGREWFVDMDNPFADNLFYSTFHRNITRQDDGSWRIGGSAVRLNVIIPPGSKLWKNIEITGYAKIVGIISSSANNNNNNESKDEVESQDYTKDLSWRGRGGRHNSKNPCEGTALIGTIDIDGNVRWQKEIWHTAIIILPIASIYRMPKYPAKILPKPTKEAVPSLIEFLASRVREIRLYFFAMLLTLNALCKDILPAASRVIIVISGLISLAGSCIIFSYA